MASTSIDAALSTQNIEIHYTNIAKLIDIEYPGKIVDPEKALSTLGGLKNLTKVGMIMMMVVALLSSVVLLCVFCLFYSLFI